MDRVDAERLPYRAADTSVHWLAVGSLTLRLRINSLPTVGIYADCSRLIRRSVSAPSEASLDTGEHLAILERSLDQPDPTDLFLSKFVRELSKSLTHSIPIYFQSYHRFYY